MFDADHSPWDAREPAPGWRLTPKSLVRRDRAERARQGQDIVPIPGTKRRKYLEENVAALGVKLTAGDLRRINEVAPPGAAAGSRYSEEMMKAVNR